MDNLACVDTAKENGVVLMVTVHWCLVVGRGNEHGKNSTTMSAARLDGNLVFSSSSLLKQMV